jgi:hypothetical protein
MLKLIYAAQRNTKLSSSDFIRRWRQHGAFTMSLPNWEHALTYVQALPLPESKPNDIDAIAIYSAKDTLFADTSRAGQDLISAIEADERETFATQIPEVAMWVSEYRIKEGPFGGFGLYVFFNAVADAKVWLATVDPNSLGRIILNVRSDIAYAAGDASVTVIPSGLPYEAVVEVNSLNVSVLTALHDSTPVDQALCVLTQEAPLWDASHKKS